MVSSMGFFECTRKDEFCVEYTCTQLQRLLAGVNKYFCKAQIMNTYIKISIYHI